MLFENLIQWVIIENISFYFISSVVLKCCYGLKTLFLVTDIVHTVCSVYLLFISATNKYYLNLFHPLFPHALNSVHTQHFIYSVLDTRYYGNNYYAQLYAANPKPFINITQYLNV